MKIPMITLMTVPGHVLMTIPADLMMIIPAKVLMMIYNKLKLVTCNYLQSVRNTMLILMIIHCVKLNYTVQHMTEFFKRTEKHFQFTWEALVSNRLAIHLLSSGSAMYDMVL